MNPYQLLVEPKRVEMPLAELVDYMMQFGHTEYGALDWITRRYYVVNGIVYNSTAIINSGLLDTSPFTKEERRIGVFAITRIRSRKELLGEDVNIQWSHKNDITSNVRTYSLSSVSTISANQANSQSEVKG